MPPELGRRELLTAAGAAAVAGCSNPLSSDPITDVTFRETRDERGRLVRPIIVEWNEPVVAVTGRIRHGSSTCNLPVLETASYSREADRLTVEVSYEREWFPGACTADLAEALYRVEVTFEGELPETVAVTTEHYDDDTERRVVDRADQRRRCERGEFESEEERDRSHWNCPEPWASDD